MNIDILNKEQQEAVRATEGRVRIIAGAGSGKTRTLVMRYAYLINEIGVDPSNILCLTFTNKAAQEMRRRISSLVPDGYYNDFVCTIHSFCLKFLREEIAKIGFPKTFTILDEEDVKSAVKSILEGLGLSREGNRVRDAINTIRRRKEDWHYIPEYFLSREQIDNDHITAESSELEKDKAIFVSFLKYQLQYMTLDFKDLIMFTCYMLSTFPEVKKKWQERFCYIMVDEAQDLNAKDWYIFETLSEYYNNLFVVGDPDQCIYEWRGAAPEAFINFKHDKNITLNRNYRSVKNVLDVANSIIQNNINRVPKELYTENPFDEISNIHFHCLSDEDEAICAAEEIHKLKEEKMADWDDIAILYRASYQSRVLEHEFIRKGIPYVIWAGIRFFERKEIKDAIAYLRLVASDDDLAIERILNVPSRKIGKTTLEKLKLFAQKEQTSIYASLKAHKDDSFLKRQAIDDFILMIENCRSKMGSSSISELLEDLLIHSGLKDYYRSDVDEERLENIGELMNSTKLYEQDNQDSQSITNYLQEIALLTNADYKNDTKKVKLMTIHQSKGLEFPYVFIVGLSEGIFPNQRTIREHKGKGLEEERRLMYVAVTRAEKKIFFTESEGYSNQAGLMKYPSRFLREINAQYINRKGKWDDSLWDGTEKSIRYIESSTNQSSSDAATIDSLEIGTEITHKMFGDGVIIEIDHAAGKARCKFECGERILLVKVLSIKEMADNPHN